MIFVTTITSFFLASFGRVFSWLDVIFLKKGVKTVLDSSTHASCDHGLEKRQFLLNFLFIMSSQEHKTQCWHIWLGSFWVIVKQADPRGCLCSVTVVTDCGAIDEKWVISTAIGNDAVTGATLWYAKRCKEAAEVLNEEGENYKIQNDRFNKPPLKIVDTTAWGQPRSQQTDTRREVLASGAWS